MPDPDLLLGGLALTGAAVVLAGAWRAGAARAGAWLALGLLGQACALQLVVAGPHVGYQHLRPFGAPPAALAGLGLQALAVVWGMRPLWGPLRGWVRARLGRWRVALLLLVLLATSAKVSRPASGWMLEMGLATALQLLQLANLIVAVAVLPDAVLERWSAGLARILPERSDRGLEPLAWWAAVAAVGTAALLSACSYQRHPHVPDEVVYLLHAEYLAAGHLSLPVPPVAEGFDLDLMLRDGERWFSPVPIGWPLVLAVGARLGVPWLVNPLLGGVGLLLAYLLVLELAGRRTARLVAVGLCISPWFAFLNMSFMTHSLTLVSAALAALGVLRARRGPGLGWPAAAGAGLGLLALIRPLEALALGIGLALWVLGASGARLRLVQIAAFLASTVAVAALTLPYNHHLTGSATKFPIMDYVDKVYGPGRNDLGFGPEKGLGWTGLDPFPGHGPLDALLNASFNVFAIGVELFGWSVGSLVLVYLTLVRGRLGRPARDLLVFVAVLVFLHGFYWFSGGPDFGARYWYLALVPLLLVSARGLEDLAREAARRGRANDGARVRVAAAALGLFALVCFFPWRAADKYRGYRGMRPDVRHLARALGFGRSLVLVRGERHPDFASAAVYNPLDLDADTTVYAWDRDAEVRAALLAQYADRPIWIVAGPSVTGSGFELLAGPLPADAVEGDTESHTLPRFRSR